MKFRANLRACISRSYLGHLKRLAFGVYGKRVLNNIIQTLYLYLCMVRRAKIKRIAIWRPFGIGDTLILHPLALKLKAIFPNAKLTVYTSRNQVSSDVAQRLPSVDRVITNPPDVYVHNFRKFLRKQFDLVLFPHYDQVYLRKYSKYFPLTHYMFSSVGLKESPEPLVYPLTYEEKKVSKSFQQSHGGYLVFVQQAGPYSRKRNWITRYWQQLIEMQERDVVLLGKGTDKMPDCVDMRNKTSIHEAAALINECRVFVSVVTGLLWVANAFKKPAVIIHGGYEPSELTRYDNSISIFSSTERSPCLTPYEDCECKVNCMEKISPETVNKKIQELLKEKTYC